jgi:predicted PurR-regulated permease PerM
MSYSKLASYFLLLILLIIVISAHLAPLLLIGLLVYLVTKRLGDKLTRLLPALIAKLSAVLIILAIITGGITLLSMTIGGMIGSEQNLTGLLETLGEIIEQLKADIPEKLIGFVPESWLAIDQESMMAFFKEHTNELRIAGTQSLHTFAQILITLAIALLLTLHPFHSIKNNKPFAAEIRQRLLFFGQSFENIVFAQVKISAVNTLLTGIFLLGVLPYFGVDLPYNKTLVALTFLTGLIPVVGNLISNTLITIVGISVSFKVAIAALVFLVLIHKLEYFINAKIIGNKINAAAWELLLALFLMEACFGIPGILLAPILYAYIKSELTDAKLI